ncbi:MAG: ribosomal protein S18-alanine N-acetyltransferase [Hyphomicrobiaceae bacterium]
MTGAADETGAGKGKAPDMRHVSLLWALPEHAVAISCLHGAAFAEGWDATAVAGLLAHPGSLALVASHGVPPMIGGFALAQVAADEAEILSVAVDGAWQRQGLAARLVDGIKRAAERSGARALFLEVAQSNEAALALYRKTGFAEAGRRKGYYAKADGGREDAVVMRCDLAAAGRPN